MDKSNTQDLVCMFWDEELKSKFRTIICSKDHSFCRECAQDYNYFKFTKF